MEENKWPQKDILELLVKFAGKKGERNVIGAQDSAYKQQVRLN